MTCWPSWVNPTLVIISGRYVDRITDRSTTPHSRRTLSIAAQTEKGAVSEPHTHSGQEPTLQHLHPDTKYLSLTGQKAIEVTRARCWNAHRHSALSTWKSLTLESIDEVSRKLLFLLQHMSSTSASCERHSINGADPNTGITPPLPPPPARSSADDSTFHTRTTPPCPPAANSRPSGLHFVTHTGLGPSACDGAPEWADAPSCSGGDALGGRLWVKLSSWATKRWSNSRCFLPLTRTLASFTLCPSRARARSGEPTTGLAALGEWGGTDDGESGTLVRLSGRGTWLFFLRRIDDSSENLALRGSAPTPGTEACAGSGWEDVPLLDDGTGASSPGTACEPNMALPICDRLCLRPSPGRAPAPSPFCPWPGPAAHLLSAASSSAWRALLGTALAMACSSGLTRLCDLAEEPLAWRCSDEWWAGLWGWACECECEWWSARRWGSVAALREALWVKLRPFSSASSRWRSLGPSFSPSNTAEPLGLRVVGRRARWGRLPSVA